MTQVCAAYNVRTLVWISSLLGCREEEEKTKASVKRGTQRGPSLLAVPKRYLPAYERIAMVIAHGTVHKILRHDVDLLTQTRLVLQRNFFLMAVLDFHEMLLSKRVSKKGGRTIRTVDEVAPSSVFEFLGDFC